MSDMGDMFKDLKLNKQDRHARAYARNRKILLDSGLPFSDRAETLLFREDGKPKVDFYPSTGRWRIPGGSTTHRGGAQAFLLWYEKARV